MKINLNENISHFLIIKTENIRYLSNFTGEDALLLINSDRKILFVDSRFTTQAKEEVFNDIEVIEYKPPIENFIFDNFEIDKLGLEDTIKYSFYNLFSQKFGVDKIVVKKDFVENFRVIKNDKEIEKISKAEEISEKSFIKTLELIKEGTSEKDLSIELEYQMKKLGGEKNGFDTIILFGERGALPHGKPGDRKLKNNEAIIFDFGTIFNGYHSDCTRTVIFGNMSSDFMEAFNIVKDAQMMGINCLKENLKGYEVDEISRNYIKDKGYGDYFGHGLGHGVGLEIHERPTLSPRGEEELKENMVVTIEPGIYIPNNFGIRIEDLVVVKKDGCLNLTKLDKYIKI
ncbi:MAG TPA: aminopeptidase P family protein [Caldisericia bacterium]|nr:aminopeptidase P family protein [Caldisericia bacterium]